MNDIQIFNNEQFGQVRVTTKDNGTWLCLSDVCKSLGLGNVTEVKKRLNSKGLSTIETLTNGGKQNLIYVDESNFYKVIFQSRKSEAEKFTEWVTSDVLPSIRKHGMYATDELINNPDLLIAAATKIKEERAARLEAEKQRDRLIHQSKLYTTSEIAKELGLKSATKLNSLLAEKKIQYKQNKTWLLYSKYADCDYVSIKQTILENDHIVYDRKWTGKGRDFILNLFKEV